MKRAAVYLRVSTDEQDTRNQEPECLKICEARGWVPVIFREVASGAKTRRPEWGRVLEAARRADVVAVVFWSMSRTGRNKVQVAQDIRDLTRYAVATVSVREPWLDQPGNGPLRALLVDIMGWLAEGERDELIERTRRGLARAAKLGRYGGRPCVIKADQVAEAKRLRDSEGLSWAQIAKRIGAKPQTVRSALLRVEKEERNEREQT